MLPHLGLHAKGFEREVQRLSKNVATNAARESLFDLQAAMEQAAIANLYRQMREARPLVRSSGRVGKVRVPRWAEVDRRAVSVRAAFL